MQVRPRRGGFVRPFGCGWFIREYLLGKGPEGSPQIETDGGAPQADIFLHYKNALRYATARDKATRQEERSSLKEARSIDPERIADLESKYLKSLPYKATGCRYHSFVVYFSNLTRLGWVEASGKVESSSFQTNYPSGPSRIFYRLTEAGRSASDTAWANPLKALYGSS